MGSLMRDRYKVPETWPRIGYAIDRRRYCVCFFYSENRRRFSVKVARKTASSSCFMIFFSPDEIIGILLMLGSLLLERDETGQR